MSIQRIGVGPRMSAAVIHGDTIYLAGQVADKAAGGGVGVPPTDAERDKFRYPRLIVSYRPEGAPPSNARAFAKFSSPGVYSTTVTQPAEFRAYLLEQLQPLYEEFGADIEVGVGAQEIA